MESSPGSVGDFPNEALLKTFSVSASSQQLISFNELDGGLKVLTTQTTKKVSSAQQQGVEETCKVTEKYPSNPHTLTKAQGERIEANRLLAMKKLYRHM